MFRKFILDSLPNLFDQLTESVEFEKITNGRKGANLVDYKDNLIPLVRTTTVYHIPNQKFLSIHYELINQIKIVSNNEDLGFNNALIELYDDRYCDMGYHSDQALDLDQNSYICLFSCYDDPTTGDLRKLKIKNKTTSECFEIVLEHNSVVLFSTDTNREHLHKIVLEPKNRSTNLWLGITFRKSKTFISFNNGLPYFSLTDKILTLADERQRKEFYKLRGLENSQIEYSYPEINYTISVGDLMLIDN